MSSRDLKRGVVDNSVAPSITVRRGCVSERLSGARENIPAAWPCTDCTSDILANFRCFFLSLGIFCYASSKNYSKKRSRFNTGDVSDVVMWYDVVGFFGGALNAVSVLKRCRERTTQDRQRRKS